MTMFAGGLVTTETATPDDGALVAAFRAGDRRSFETLVRRHERLVVGVLRRFHDDRDVVDDLAQRAFVTALERIADLRGAFRPWLLRIAANLAKNHLRDHAKFVRDEPDRAIDPRPDEAMDLARRRGHVRTALAALSERQREIVLLRIDGEVPFAQIAESLGITENNAKVTYCHATRRLRELVGGSDDAL